MQVPEGRRDREPGVKQMGPSAPDLETLALSWKLLWLLRNNMINNTERGSRCSHGWGNII